LQCDADIGHLSFAIYLRVGCGDGGEEDNIGNAKHVNRDIVFRPSDVEDDFVGLRQCSEARVGRGKAGDALPEGD